MNYKQRTLNLNPSLSDTSLPPWSPYPTPSQQPSISLAAALVRVARLRISLALLCPMICAVVLAYWQSAQPWSAAASFAILSAFAGALGLNLMSEFHDYRRSLMLTEQPPVESLNTGFELLVNRRLLPGFVHSAALFAFVLAALCTGWSALLAGWPLLFFGGLSLLLAIAYSAPPLRYVYRGAGLGELGTWLSFGFLQSLAGYYAQAQTLNQAVAWMSIPFGMMAMLALSHVNFIHHRRDWLIQKRTLVVHFGPERALDISTILVVISYIALLLIASFALLPLRVLIALTSLPVVIGAYTHVDREMMGVHDGIHLTRAAANAALLTTLLFCLVLWFG